MDKGRLTGSGSYDELVHKRFARGIYKAAHSSTLINVSCAKIHNLNIANAPCFRIFEDDVSGPGRTRDSKLDLMAEKIKNELQKFAVQNRQGDIFFGLGCHGRGSHVVCTIQFEEKKPQKKPKKKAKEEEKDTKGAIQGPAPSTTQHRQPASGPGSSVQGPPERSGEGSLGDQENPKLPSAVSERENGHSSSLEEGQVKPSSPDCLDKGEHSERCPLTEERSGHQSNATGQGGPDLSQVEEGGPGPVTMVEEGPHPPRGEESEDQGLGQV
ncbi:unnamed protein product [Cylicocyclus nassatus]|uniref:Uncharacterized protein n=1 Tax=Cylicocyclus nassatus TaxID=53992 RepID=A0AA36M9Z8_CYLNA|nr:unnamed protein product [Cylicocyclus nassatus]